jgi:hypothetical protein
MSKLTPPASAPLPPTPSSDGTRCCGGPSPVAGACCVRDAEARAAGAAGCDCAPGACACDSSAAPEAATAATRCC